MISTEMLVAARDAVEELAAGDGCPTVLLELVDRLELLQQAGWSEEFLGSTTSKNTC